MSLDINVLQHELQTIRSERETRGRGRGRGRGFFPGRGRGQPDEQPAERTEPDAPAGLSASLSARLGSRGGEERPSFPSKRMDQHDFRLRKAEFRDRNYSRDNYDAPREDTDLEAQAPLPGSNTDRLASAVVVERVQEDFKEPRKRPTENGPVNPAQQKRAKRLFGSLLGTLQKFQEEDQRFKRTKLAQDRADAEVRAEQRAQQDSEKIREKQKQDIAKARISEINKKRELDVQLQVKEKEIQVAQRIAKEMELVKWLKTGTSPSLLWLPKVHNEDTRLLLEQRLVDVDAWEVEKLEKETKQMLDRFTPVNPKPSLPEAKVEEVVVEMEPGEAVPTPEAATKDTNIERYEAEEGEDAANEIPEEDAMDSKEESS